MYSVVQVDVAERRGRERREFGQGVDVGVAAEDRGRDARGTVEGREGGYEVVDGGGEGGGSLFDEGVGGGVGEEAGGGVELALAVGGVGGAGFEVGGADAELWEGLGVFSRGENGGKGERKGRTATPFSFPSSTVRSERAMGDP